MKKRIFSKLFRPISSGTASVIIAFATVLSYTAGLLRDILMSNYFGASQLTDAYNAAFLVPDMVYTLTTAGALSGIFLPVFRNREKKNKDDAAELAGSFFILGQLLVLVVAVVAFIAMPWIVEGFIAKASNDQTQLIINMSRILLVSPIVMSISNTLGTVLITFKHYLAYALSAAFYNVGIIAGIYFFNGEFGIYSAVIGVLIGLGFHLVIRVFDFAFLDFSFKFRFWNPGIKKVASLAMPKTLGLLVWQVSLWAYNNIGLTVLSAGSISAFYYARNIQSFAVSLFGISVATAVFPFIVDFKEDGKIPELIQKIESTLLQIFFFAVPAAVGMGLLSNEIITVLLKRGEFDERDVVLTAGVLFFFAFSIPFESAMHLLSRVYYAFHNTIIPVSINMVFLFINLTMSFTLAVKYGVNIFAISFVTASLVQVFLLFAFIGNFVDLHFRFLINRTLRIVFGSAVMGTVVYLIRDFSGFGVWFTTGLSVMVGVIVYFIVMHFLDMLRYAGLKRIGISFKSLFRK